MKKWLPERSLRYEEFAVLVSGASVMGIEMVAGRILAPEFGSSVYTWGSIIGVFMAALSIGYYIGGKRSEQHASYHSLSLILVQSAAFVAFLMLAGEYIITMAAAVPVAARYAAILPSVILFGPPVFLLGFISPYAAQLSKKSSTGEASGNVFAIGTLGSIVGTFATTFLLIPYLSIMIIELFFGSLLVAGALVLSLSRASFPGGIWQRASYPVLVGLLLAAVFVVNTSGVGGGFGESGVVHQTQTPYQELVVKDSNGVRTMYLNDQPQSAMYLNGSNDHVYRYTRYFHLPFLMVDDPEEIEHVLFIGGGGFTGPKRFVDDYDVEVDVVEIDPDVIRAAKQYFNVRESPDLHIHEMDGREFLQNTDKTYDMIVMDAYQKSSVPFHLTTREFMQLASDKMDNDGLLYTNLIASKTGPSSQIYRAEYKTMQDVFPTVYSFTTSRTPFNQNIELIASKNPEKLSQQQLWERNQNRGIGIDLEYAITFYQEDVDTSGVDVLTDDKAPVDKLMEPMIGEEYVIEE